MKNVLLLVLFIPAIAGAAVYSGNPRLIGDEVFVYTMDAADHNKPEAQAVRDRSPNGNHGTHNRVQLTTGKRREGYDFQVEDYWISVPDHATSNRREGTLLMWVNLRSYRGEGKLFVKNRPGVNTEMGVTLDSNGRVRFMTSQQGGSTLLISNQGIPLNTWTHVGVTWGPSGKKIYINGVLDTSDADAAGVGANSTHTFIGNDPNMQWLGGVDGAIDDVRFHATALEAFYVNSLRKQAYWGSTNTTASAWLIGGERFVYQMDGDDHDKPSEGQTRDSSPLVKHGTLKQVSPTPGRFGGAYEFDLYNYWIAVPDDVTSSMDNGTLALWVKLYSYFASSKLFVKNRPGIHTEMGVLLDSAGRVMFTTSQGGGTTELVSNRSIPLNVWTHITVTWGSSGKRIYINGVLDTSNADTVGVGSISTHTYIGNDPAIPEARGVDGVLDDVRFYSGALRPLDIEAVATLPYR